VLEMTL